MCQHERDDEAVVSVVITLEMAVQLKQQLVTGELRNAAVLLDTPLQLYLLLIR